MKQKPDFFDGAYRCTFEGKDPDSHAPLHYLENDGIVLPDGSRPNPLAFYDAQRGVWMRPASRLHGFDFGTVPSRAQSLVSPIRWSRAFVFHDAAYPNHGWCETGFSTPDGPFTFRQVTRAEADGFLIRWMVADGSSFEEAYVAYEGVFLAGEKYWKRHKGPFPCCEFLGLPLSHPENIPHPKPRKGRR